MIRLGNNEVLKTLTKTLTFVDADANANANANANADADAGGSTIALPECCSGELKTYLRKSSAANLNDTQKDETSFLCLGNALLRDCGISLVSLLIFFQENRTKHTMQIPPKKANFNVKPCYLSEDEP